MMDGSGKPRHENVETKWMRIESQIKERKKKKKICPRWGLNPQPLDLNLPMLYRLSYKASKGAGRGNLGSELWLMYK